MKTFILNGDQKIFFEDDEKGGKTAIQKLDEYIAALPRPEVTPESIDDQIAEHLKIINNSVLILNQLCQSKNLI